MFINKQKIVSNIKPLLKEDRKIKLKYVKVYCPVVYYADDGPKFS